MAQFIAADGYLDIAAVTLLMKEMNMYVRKYKVEPKTDAVYMVRRTMKPYAKDLTERQVGTRIQMIKMRKSFPKLGTRCSIVLAVYKDEAFQEDFKKDIHVLEKAIEAHNKKAEKAALTKKEANAKVRDKNAKILADLVKEVDSVAAANDMKVETIFSSATAKGYLLEIDGKYLSLNLATPTAIAKIGLEAPKPGAGLAASRAKAAASGKKPVARKAPVKIVVRESSKIVEKPVRKTTKKVAETAPKTVKAKPVAEKKVLVEKKITKAAPKAAVKTAKVVAKVEKPIAKTAAKKVVAKPAVKKTVKKAQAAA